MSSVLKTALQIGPCSISWPSNPPESGLQPHFDCFSTLLNGYRYSGRADYEPGAILVPLSKSRDKLDERGL